MGIGKLEPLYTAAGKYKLVVTAPKSNFVELSAAQHPISRVNISDIYQETTAGILITVCFVVL